MTEKKLKSLNEMFHLGSSNPETSQLQLQEEIEINKLVPFKNHPFKLYEGERLKDMINSIKERGVIVPVIIRPVHDSYGSIVNYEILAGHNRVNAAKLAGIDTVPVRIKENLTDDEALLIVTETNLYQRSFSELSHSERVLVLTVHYKEVKAQGKRNDLISEIELFSRPQDLCASEDSKITHSASLIGEKYSLSKDTIKRYLRLENINQGLMARLDCEKIALRSAVSLSYLKADEQERLEYILESDDSLTLDMKKAEAMRQQSERGRLTDEHIHMILAGQVKTSSKSKPTEFKIKPKIISKYFSGTITAAEVEETIEKALDLYFSNQGEDD